MHDDRIYDAVNLFKFSVTGRGAANIGGDAAYQAKYRSLATAVIEKLWFLWRADEIGFHNLGPNLVGNSNVRVGHDIRVNTLIEPSSNAMTYQDAANQGKLAATSCNIVHEATHLVSSLTSYPEEETLCRTIQTLYFRDLILPRSYQSRFAAAQCTAAFLPTTTWYHAYMRRLNRYLSHDLVDSVFDIAEYRRDLETDRTAQFIKRSLGWWGGISARWPSTRGYYLRSLASREGQNYAAEILRILESLSRAQWLIARTTAGNLQRIRRAFAPHLYEMPVTVSLTRVQDMLGENFGIQSG